MKKSVDKSMPGSNLLLTLYRLNIIYVVCLCKKIVVQTTINFAFDCVDDFVPPCSSKLFFHK
jgi:hypothetical protein